MNSLTWTRIVDRALDIVLSKYPARTGLGVVTGLLLHLLAELFSPALKAVPFLDISSLGWWQWLAPGLLIMHAPTILSILKQRSIGNDEVDQVLQLIERGNFSESERRQQYRMLINRVIDKKSNSSLVDLGTISNRKVCR